MTNKLSEDNMYNRRDCFKKPFEDDEEYQTMKRFKHEPNNLIDRNPVSILNELKGGLRYDIVEKSGPSHNPTFTICVEVNGQKYFGKGNSKKSAKSVAAAEVLKSIIQFPTNGLLITRRQSGLKQDPINKCLVVKEPLMLLKELYPKAKFSSVKNDKKSGPEFTVFVTIKNETFVGKGSTKKKGRLNAATSALKTLISYSNKNVFNLFSEDQEIANAVDRLVEETLETLTYNFSPCMKKKVLVGLIVTKRILYLGLNVIECPK